jgi:hypothetical protein
MLLLVLLVLLERPWWVKGAPSWFHNVLNYCEKVQLNIEQNLRHTDLQVIVPSWAEPATKKTKPLWPGWHCQKLKDAFKRKLKVMQGSAIMWKHEGESKFKLEPMNTSCMVIRWSVHGSLSNKIMEMGNPETNHVTI